MVRIFSRNFWLRDVRHLMRQESFRAHPFAIIGRGGLWVLYSALGISPEFRLIKGGPRLKVDSQGEHIGSGSAYVMRDWAEPELHYLKLFLSPGDTFIDCGANIGVYSLMAEMLVGEQGRVVAVEPGKDSVRRLRRNLALNHSSIQVVNKALSEQEGVTRLYHSGDGPAAFSLVETAGNGDYEEVETTTLDAVVQQAGLSRVDCIKIDVEGYEPIVLGGGRNVLQHHHPHVIFEINSNGAKRMNIPVSSAWDLLQQFDYCFYRLSKGCLQQLAEYPDYGGNIIAIHKRSALPTT